MEKLDTYEYVSETVVQRFLQIATLKDYGSATAAEVHQLISDTHEYLKNEIRLKEDLITKAPELDLMDMNFPKTIESTWFWKVTVRERVRYCSLHRGYNNSVILRIFTIPIEEGSKKKSILQEDFRIRMLSVRELEVYFPVLLRINSYDYKISFYDNKVAEIKVHKLDDFGVYWFNIGKVKYIVSIEKHGSSKSDYVIRIGSPSDSSEAMKIEAVKSGKYFRSVLLKKLNDWYKKKFNKRAKFIWGETVKVN